MQNKALLLLACAVLSLSALIGFHTSTNRLRSQTQDRKQPMLTKDGKLSKQDRIDLAMLHEFKITKDPVLNRVPRERLVAAEAYRTQKLAAKTGWTLGAVPGLIWEERGPNNVAGRTRALMFDLNDAGNGYKKVWAGSVSGGLWYTNDITVTTPAWAKVNDLSENLAISCLVQNPTNTQEMYVGTGEGWYNIDAVRGLGIWKSTNGGATWIRLASTLNFKYVNDLLVTPAGHLYAAVRSVNGAAYAGIQKSTDGGATWSRVLDGTAFGSGNEGADLELSANGDLYASFGVFSSGGIYLSNAATNGAATGNAGTWANITPNSAGAITLPAGFWQRIKLAAAPSDNNVLYALFQGSGSSNCASIQAYDKATNTWAVKTIPTIIDQGSNSNFTRGQAWYNLAAAVDPANANALYIGGIDALRSDNGGSAWTQMTTWSLFGATGFNANQRIHADHHAIVYAPGSSSRMLVGTDGGIYYTTNADVISTSKPTFSSKNTGYNVTQYYACAMSPTLTNYFLAGAQDNGTQRFTAAGLGSATTPVGGDGGFCHIDQNDNNVQIASYVYNNYYVSTNGGASFAARNFNNAGGFINPTDYDNTANVLYGGDAPGSFLRWTDVATAGTTATTVTCAEFNGAEVTHVAVSPAVANRVFFGLNNGDVVRIENANASNTGIIVRNATSGSVSCIATDPTNPDHMLVTYSNYGIISVYETTNATAATPSWTAVEGNLPDMPVRWAMFDPRNSDLAILATELGVWSTDNLNGAATDWQPTNIGLANVRVDMLQYRAGDRTIAAATHGRGLFTASIPTTLPVILTDFNGRLNGDAVDLTWYTESERNAHNFDVEKSADGTRFYKIGSVSATGNSSVRRSYVFTDRQPAAVNYYRLRMNDYGGAYKISGVISIQTSVHKQKVWVVNNPFRDAVGLGFAKAGASVRMQLLATNGTVLVDKRIASASGQVHWALPNNLPKSAYLLRVTVGGDVFTQRVVKQ